jgi:hypothetical protein
LFYQKENCVCNSFPALGSVFVVFSFFCVPYLSILRQLVPWCLNKRRRYKAVKRVALILVPLLIVAGGWVYFKLYGFKRALEDLVDSQTHGEYTLVIDKSSVDFSALSFSFKTLSIQRNPGLPATGIHAVNIPSMNVRFGSLMSMLAFERFHIKSLTMDEPEIVVDVPPKREGSMRVDLTQQIVKLYPPVESLLSHFDIESLSIRRATIELKRPHDALVRLRLVDLLVKDWDIQSLTQNSQLKLNISGQGLDFGKAGLSFSEIEYNFQQRHLFFTDFSFTSVDTVSDSRVEVKGKSLRLQHLDYKELYEKQRYMLRRAEITEPRVMARFKLKKSKRQGNEEGDMFTRIVKQSIGECHLDSAVIKNAEVHLVIQRERDSVQIDLPRVDFRLHTFKVHRDSSSFSIGELGINLNRTAISLRNNLSLHFREILFDRHQDLTIVQAALVDSARRENIATVGRLRLEYFDLLGLVLDKQFYARRVDIDRADIRLDATRVSQNQTVDLGLKDISVRRMAFTNSAVHYTDAEKVVHVNGLGLSMNDVGYDSLNGLRYALKTVKIKDASLKHNTTAVTTRIQNIAFDGRHLSAGAVDLLRDSLHVVAKDVTADTKLPHKPGDYRSWKTIRCGSLDLSGLWSAMPRQSSHEPQVPTTIDEVKIDRVTVAIRKGTSHISFAGKDVATNGIVVKDADVQWKALQGELSGLRIANAGVQANVGDARLSYPGIIKVTNVDVTTTDLKMKFREVGLRSIGRAKDQWSVKRVSVAGVEVMRRNEPLLVADSVKLLSVYAGASHPDVGKAEVFGPIITVPAKTNTSGVGKEKRKGWFVPDEVVIHPGTLKLRDESELQFGTIESESATGILQCAYVHTMLGKRPMQLKGLQLEGDELSIDSMTIRDDPRAGGPAVEDDKIDARLYSVVVAGISIDAGMQTGVWKDLDIGLERFAVDIRRDKRLPDPPMMEKPFTLEGFLKLPKNVQINKVRLKDGSLRYMEIAEQSGEEAVVTLDNISAILEFNRATGLLNVNAKTRLYGSGMVDLKYQTLNERSFRLNVKVRDFDLTRLNQVLVPLHSVRVRSGFLLAYDLDVIAGDEKATGEAAITYRDLHLELLKRNDPDRRGLRMELINLLADGIILRNRRELAVADVSRQRIRHKSIFNYWVKTIFHGALATVKNGKRARK